MIWLLAVLLVMVARFSVSSALCELRAHRTEKSRRSLLDLCLATVSAGLLAVIFLGLREWRAMGLVVPLLLPLLLNRKGANVNPALVWWKKQLKRTGKEPSGVWKKVSDDFWWEPPRRPSDAPVILTELIAADAPSGLGIEPEAAAPPEGPGSELQAAVEVGHTEANALGNVRPEADRLPQ